MRYILFIAAFLISSLAHGQGTWNKSSTNNAWNRTKADSVAIVPRDTSATNNAILPSTGQPVGDYGRIQAKHGLFYFHDSIRNRRMAFYDEVPAAISDSLKNDKRFWSRLGVVMPTEFANRDSTEKNNSQEPTVIYDSTGIIFTSATMVYKMWYTSGFNTTSIHYAESLDGLNWVNYSGNPIITGNHAHSSVTKYAGTYYLYASIVNTGAQIDVFTSTDGVTFTLTAADVIHEGAPGTWNEDGVWNTSVIVDGGVWRMLVDGRQIPIGYQQGYYTSLDGLAWTPYAGNPVLGGNNQGGVWLKKIGSTFWIWCQQTDTNAVLPTNISRYKSPDMINWTADPGGYTFVRKEDDEGPQSSVGQVADPCVVSVGGKSYMYYTANRDGSSPAGRATIKVAVIPLSMEDLVTVAEADNGSVTNNGVLNPSVVYLSDSTSEILTTKTYARSNFIQNQTSGAQIGGAWVSGKLRADNGGVFLGNTGVGTTNPLQQFVVSNGGVEGIEIAFDAGFSILESFNRGTGLLYPLGFSGNKFNFGTGNVGINNTSPTSKLDIIATNGYTQFRLRTQYTPSSSADSNGSAGDVAIDDNYIYFKTSTGWKRSALTSF